MHNAFHLTTARGDGGVRISAEGELDHGSAQTLLDGFTQALADHNHDEMTLDLGRLRFIDSSGMRALIAVEQEASRRGATLVVVPPADEVTRLLEISGVAGRVNLVHDPETPPRESGFLERMELEFPADERAPRRARAALRESIGEAVDEATLASLVLMTSELVTNAVVHSCGEPATHSEERAVVGLRTTRFPDAVRVEVDDPGAGFDPSETGLPEDDIPGPEEGGRGLFVVDSCARRWGTRQAETDRGRRFSVWFEVQLA